ncbi:hypothetical protein Chor_001871, partial [Crotalus horridus]
MLPQSGNIPSFSIQKERTNRGRGCPSRSFTPCPSFREQAAWTLQETLQDSLFRFQDWLWAAERVASSPRSSLVSYNDSRKELQRFRALQKDVSEKVWPLASLNRQYHQLVWMGGISPRLRSSVQEVNRRWEELQTRAAAVSRRLQHFVNQWEEFGQKKGDIQVRLMELDLRLTDVEHFSAGTWLEKMQQLQVFEDEWESDRDSDSESDCFTEGSLPFRTGHPESAALIPQGLLLHSTPQSIRCCRASAPIGDSSAADLEWDPSVDVGGSTSQDE